VGWLRNIPIDFDLFVSVPRENAGALRTLVLRDHPQAQVLEVPNAGRDVGAFFRVLPRVLAGNYSVLCKLHSKKGSEYPEAWRDLLLRGLLANKMLVIRILHAFARDPELALAGAREVYLSGTTQMTQNRDKVEEITRFLYPGRSIPARASLPARCSGRVPISFGPSRNAVTASYRSRATTRETMASSRMRWNACSVPLQHSQESGSA
jgi:lipopolysaccharide biosynthesis protein